MSRIRNENKNEDLGFQIAPMIDVVFVIMLFFMVKVGARQVEMEIKSKLPGSAETSTSISGMEALEENIAIDQDGVISHNDEVLEGMSKDSSEGNDEKQLKERMKRLAEQSKADKTEVIVTVSTQPDTKYQRIVKVLNVLNYAEIRHVTFTVAEEL